MKHHQTLSWRLNPKTSHWRHWVQAFPRNSPLDFYPAQIQAEQASTLIHLRGKIIANMSWQQPTLQECLPQYGRLVIDAWTWKVFVIWSCFAGTRVHNILGILKPCSLVTLQSEIQSIQQNSTKRFAVVIFKCLSWLGKSKIKLHSSHFSVETERNYF